jgi:hypothetical protein
VNKSIGAATFVLALIVAGAAVAQSMLLDFAADKVIQKYQTSTCAQLKQQKAKPKSEKEKMAVEFLRNDSQARVAFMTRSPHPSPISCSNAA